MIKPNHPSARRVGTTVAQRLRQASLEKVQQRSRLGTSMAPSQDWKTSRQTLLRALSDNENLRHQMVYSLEHSSSGNSIFPPFGMELTDQMREQIRISRTQLTKSIDEYKAKQRHIADIPLPRTLNDALHDEHSNRALVVTEIASPFRIVNVNKAWEGLCGYTYVESQGKTMRELLQGEETDQASITAVMSLLIRGEEAGTVLTNYTKQGRKFRNRLRVGPLFDTSGTISHFVGELSEVKM